MTKPLRSAVQQPVWMRHIAALQTDFDRYFPNRVEIVRGSIDPGSLLEDLAVGYREARHLPAMRVVVCTWAWTVLVPLEALDDHGHDRCMEVAVGALCKEGQGSLNQMRMRHRASPRIYWRLRPEVDSWLDGGRQSRSVGLRMRCQLEGETLGGNKPEGQMCVELPFDRSVLDA